MPRHAAAPPAPGRVLRRGARGPGEDRALTRTGAFLLTTAIGCAATLAAYALIPRTYTSAAWVVAGDDPEAQAILRAAAGGARATPEGLLVTASARTPAEAQAKVETAVRGIRSAVSRKLEPASLATLPALERTSSVAARRAAAAEDALYAFEHDAPAAGAFEDDPRRREVLALSKQMDDPDPRVALRARQRLFELSSRAAEEQDRRLEKKLRAPAARQRWEELQQATSAATADALSALARVNAVKEEQRAAEERLSRVIRYAEPAPLPTRPTFPRPTFLAFGAALSLALALLAAAFARR